MREVFMLSNHFVRQRIREKNFCLVTSLYDELSGISNINYHLLRNDSRPIRQTLLLYSNIVCVAFR